MQINKENIANYGDVLAVPFFALAVYYFYSKDDRTFLEDVLLLFVIAGFICDLLFSMLFLKIII